MSNNNIVSSNVLNYLPLNEPSLYIKWSPKYVTSKDVYNILTELNLGLIDRVQSRPTLNNKNQQEGIAFTIYMTEWYRNSNADQTRLKLINDDDNFITITYEPNKYWKVYSHKLNNSGSRRNNLKQEHNFKPSIKFNDNNLKTHENIQTRQVNNQYNNQYNNDNRYERTNERTNERTKRQERQKSSQLHNQQNNQRLKFLNPAETLKSISVTFDETKTSETNTNETKKRNWLSDSDTDEEEK